MTAKKATRHKPNHHQRGNNNKDNNINHRISPRRRYWRSTAPRSQHAWQKSAMKRADTVDATDLQRIYSVLSRLYRRNRNQHRGQAWWKLLAGLRRRVGDLVRIEDELEGGGKVESTVRGDESGAATAAPAEAATASVGTAAMVRQRLRREAKSMKRKKGIDEFVRDMLLPRCYVAFAAVVRDKQFAALGVVLIGVLASVGAIVGLPVSSTTTTTTNSSFAAPSRLGIEKVETTSTRQTGAGKGEVIKREYKGGGGRGDVDFGEVVERRPEDNDQDGETATAAVVKMDVLSGASDHLHTSTVEDKARAPVIESESSPEPVEITQSTQAENVLSKKQTVGETKPSEREKMKRRTKKKGKSAIDELFAGLI